MIWCYIHTIDLKLGCNLKKGFDLGPIHFMLPSVVSSTVTQIWWMSLTFYGLWLSCCCETHKMCVTWGWKGVFGILLRFIKQESLVCILLGTFPCHIFLFSLFTCYFDFHLLVIFKHNINYFLRVRKGTQFKLQHTLSHQ